MLKFGQDHPTQWLNSTQGVAEGPVLAELVAVDLHDHAVDGGAVLVARLDHLAHRLHERRVARARGRERRGVHGDGARDDQDGPQERLRRRQHGHGDQLLQAQREPVLPRRPVWNSTTGLGGPDQT